MVGRGDDDAVGVVAFNELEERVEDTTNLTNFVARLIGWAALGETVSALQALGALAVAAGILIVTAER